MRKGTCLLLSFVLVLLAAASARAQSPGAYIGAGGGSSMASFNSSDFSLGLPQVAESADKTSMGWKIFAGYRFNRNFAAELGYAGLGTFKYKYNGGAAGTAEFDYEVSGITLSGIAALPLSDEFSLFLRAGAFGSKAKNTLSNATGNVGTSLANAGFTPGSSASVNETTLSLGAGAEYEFQRQFAVRFEYEYFGEVGNSNDTGRVAVSLISANLLFRLRE